MGAGKICKAKNMIAETKIVFLTIIGSNVIITLYKYHFKL